LHRQALERLEEEKEKSTELNQKLIALQQEHDILVEKYMQSY
jgi:hypothetical protein